ncbi:unnamed protein product [Linum tenue]|uniref:Uncharacterized protein n=1 Tax=Linum tenue TaxID=586396 RepID=A0AAV0LSP9_9ROSI|nr:unnamed protein product [Linum tenue]
MDFISKNEQKEESFEGSDMDDGSRMMVLIRRLEIGPGRRSYEK